jgi:NAD(P)-dependent dehydrogenase (short-subunit alcohol dehydrogenase family)
MSTWKDQVAVITGAASGIGAGLAAHCAGLGMHVLAGDVDDAGLTALATRTEGPAASLRTVHTDVSSSASVETLAQLAFDAHGQVNLLFNNAGVLVDGKSWERSERDWRWNLDVNVMGVVNGIRSFVPRMLEQGAPGRVVNTSSIGGLIGGGAFMGPYQASKHAVVAISETLFGELSLEAAPIEASVLCPGDVATGIWESDRLRSDAERNELRSDAERAFHDILSGQVAAGIDPAELARRCFEGIDAGRFWILPQPGFKPMFELCVERILAESEPPSMQEMAKFQR